MAKKSVSWIHDPMYRYFSLLRWWTHPPFQAEASGSQFSAHLAYIFSFFVNFTSSATPSFILFEIPRHFLGIVPSNRRIRCASHHLACRASMSSKMASTLKSKLCLGIDHSSDRYCFSYLPEFPEERNSSTLPSATQLSTTILLSPKIPKTTSFPLRANTVYWGSRVKRYHGSDIADLISQLAYGYFTVGSERRCWASLKAHHGWWSPFWRWEMRCHRSLGKMRWMYPSATGLNCEVGHSTQKLVEAYVTHFLSKHYSRYHLSRRWFIMVADVSISLDSCFIRRWFDLQWSLRWDVR